MAKQKWQDLSRQRRGVIIALASVELTLTAAAAADLARRPADLVRGPKPLWWLAIFVQPVGPVAYLAWGRGPSTR
ncbi:PLDc N-terminal domain-containing protein [Micromonospora sp. NPDC093277]|uniref:PLDc N-terminal domain-containing protein n=1 Tax=Micromonospora sp. NPDC093277 TaxID=3364291 RepID=UPI00381CCA7B